MPQLPRDSLAEAIESGSTFAPIAVGTTWLSFSLQRFKLYQIARDLNLAFYGHELKVKNGDSVYDDYRTMDDLASSWGPQATALKDWAEEIPQALKNKRENGHAFSCAGSKLVLEQYAPLWLQRQRVLLELEYHHLCINLYRPFISFSVPQGESAVIMAAKCAQHAMELTSITHQALTTTKILHGWHEALQWQWSAAMTMIGFVVANTQHSLALALRNSIGLAVSVLDIFAPSFEAAAKAVIIVRTLHTNIESVMAQFEVGADGLLEVSGEVPLLNKDVPLQDGIAGSVPNQFDAIGNDFDLIDMAMH
ncbi:hypothetical protein ACLX1H_000592 [Fusarium chlamydosporum]